MLENVSMRKKLYRILDSRNTKALVGRVYDYAMIVVIIASLIPLAFKESNALFYWTERICLAIFIVDYIARWACADLKLHKGGLSFLIYPFTPMAIIDLLSILPGITVLNEGFKSLRTLRLLRVLRVFKLLRYSKSVYLIGNVFRKQKRALLTVGTLAIAYILISALIVFDVEPDTFDNFFDAVYWATVSLTTVGYGDIYPVSDFGRIIAMCSSIIGIAVVALPSGIITASYLDELQSYDEAALLKILEEEEEGDGDIDELPLPDMPDIPDDMTQDSMPQ